MDIRPWAESEAAHWDTFVRRHPQGTFFHLSGWKRVIEQTFGFPAYYAYVEKDREIQGVFPLFKVRGLWGQSPLVSVPFGVYGGILASSEAAQHALLEEGKRLAVHHSANYIELKSIQKQIQDLPTKGDLYVTFLQALHSDPDANLEQIPRKTRRMVRISLKNGLEAEITREGLGDFYEIYSTSLHHLGTPAFPRALFHVLLDIFPHESFFLFVRHHGQRIGGVLTLVYNNGLLPYYGGAYREYNHLAVNNFMYWKLIEHGCQTGYSWFDFGRSKKNVKSGSYDFKRHWGMREVNLEYQYYLRPGVLLPNINPSNPKYKFFMAAWKKLPFSLTKIIGPRLVRYFP